jgi:hypothetical protein
VQIIAHNLDKGTDQATVTGSDGIFTFTNLEPGRYEVAAAKSGFQKSSKQIEVVALQATRVELPLRAAADVRQTTAKSDDLPLTERERQFLARIDRLEQRLVAMEEKQGNEKETATNATPEKDVLVASIAPVALPGALSTRPAAVPIPLPTPQPAPAAAAAPPAPAVPEALQTPEPGPAVDNFTPFAFGDFTWLNGTPRNKDTVLDTKFFTPEIRFDTN